MRMVRNTIISLLVLGFIFHLCRPEPTGSPLAELPFASDSGLQVEVEDRDKFDDFYLDKSRVKQVEYADEITQKSYYKLVGPLRNMKKNDILILRLNSPGGSVRHTLIIIEAMKQAKGQVIARVDSGCYSGCAMLVGYADKLSVGRHSLLMWHMPRTYSGHVLTRNDPNPVYALMAKRAERVLRESVGRYLYKKEYQRIIDGEDVFITGRVFKARWDIVENRRKR